MILIMTIVMMMMIVGNNYNEFNIQTSLVFFMTWFFVNYDPPTFSNFAKQSE